MLAFMAGAISSGAVMARAVVDSRSSAMPFASFARQFAEAGAMTYTSAHFASDMCSRDFLGSKVSVTTGLPLRVSKVSGGTNLAACSVSTTRTCAPCLTSRLTRSQAL